MEVAGCHADFGRIYSREEYPRRPGERCLCVSDDTVAMFTVSLISLIFLNDVGVASSYGKTVSLMILGCYYTCVCAMLL